MAAEGDIEVEAVVEVVEVGVEEDGAAEGEVVVVAGVETETATARTAFSIAKSSTSMTILLTTPWKRPIL